MVPKEPQFKNNAEKRVFELLNDYLRDNTVVYYNKEVNGLQFDFCVLMPDMAILIIEVKGWKETHNIEINDDAELVIYRQQDGSEESSDYPKNQSRKYRMELINKIKRELDIDPKIFDMVCYPNISKEYYYEVRLDIASGGETWTIFKEDLIDRESLIAKIRQAYSLAKINFGGELLTTQMMRAVRTLYESEEHIQMTNLDADNRENPRRQDHEQDPGIETDVVDTSARRNYSLLVYLENCQGIEELFQEYQKGTKLYLLAANKTVYDETLLVYQECLMKLNLTYTKGQLTLANSGHFFTIDEKAKSANTNVYISFNLLLTYPTGDLPSKMSGFTIADGQLDDMENHRQTLQWVDDASGFNFNQYQVEHIPKDKHILVEAGAGTGKTFSMISRLTYLQYINGFDPEDFIKKIVMITFTNEAADNMKVRLKECFQNYYMLTRDYLFFSFIELIDSIRISTIHSLSKGIIQKYASHLGCGIDIGIVSGDYERKEFIELAMEEYMQDKLSLHQDFAQDLKIPIYNLKKMFLEILNKLSNKSIDIARSDLDFLDHDGSEMGEIIHDMIQNVLKKAEGYYQDKLVKDNNIHLGNLIIKLDHITGLDSIDLSAIKAEYLFVDEFQDTDNVQIELMKKFQTKIGFKFFVVGDIKQCIYRFRGAEEAAFDVLVKQSLPDDWKSVSLNKNYRTDRQLLQQFEEYFCKWGSTNPQKLVYIPGKSTLKSHLEINNMRKKEEYHRSVSLANSQDKDEIGRALIKEITERTQEIQTRIDQGEKLKDKDRTIAVLVRENWEARQIHEYGKDAVKYGGATSIFIEIDTGGDLYSAEPVLDLYKLVLALKYPLSIKHLYNLTSTSYFSNHMKLYSLYGKTQAEKVAFLTEKLNNYIGNCCDELYLTDNTLRIWMNWVEKLKYEPVLKVLRSLINILRPWDHFAISYVGDQEETGKSRRYYKRNLELMFEKLARNNNTDYVTINRLETSLKLKITTGQHEKTRESMAPEDSTHVRIISVTVHRSKGLEFDSVIIPYGYQKIDEIKKNAEVEVMVLDEKIGYRLQYKDQENKANTVTIQNSFFNPAKEGEDRMREETRILYVALTRTIRNFTFFTYSNRREPNSWQGLLDKGAS